MVGILLVWCFGMCKVQDQFIDFLALGQLFFWFVNLCMLQLSSCKSQGPSVKGNDCRMLTNPPVFGFNNLLIGDHGGVFKFIKSLESRVISSTFQREVFHSLFYAHPICTTFPRVLVVQVCSTSLVSFGLTPASLVWKPRFPRSDPQASEGRKARSRPSPPSPSEIRFVRRKNRAEGINMTCTSTLLARLLVEGCWTLSQVSIGDLSEAAFF